MPKIEVVFYQEADGSAPVRAAHSRGLTVARKKTRSALALIARDVGKDARFRRRVEEEKLNVQVGQMIHEARTAARLTQKQLAELAGTTQPVIARLESADYEGHSLSMLRRIAEALDRRVEVRLVRKRHGLRRAS